MRELTLEEIEEEFVEQLPARELMGATRAMPASHVPVMLWYHPAGDHHWQDVGPQFYYRT
jgi:hypothetical protein